MAKTQRRAPNYSITQFTKNHRACLNCRQIKDLETFREYGCENCEYDYKAISSIIDHTTKRFDGLVAICNPKGSWVSRWIDCEDKVPGLYAIKAQSNDNKNNINDEIEAEDDFLVDDEEESAIN